MGARHDDRGQNCGPPHAGGVSLRSAASHRPTELDHRDTLGCSPWRQGTLAGVSPVLLAPFAPLFCLPTALVDLALGRAVCAHYGDVECARSRKGRPMCARVSPPVQVPADMNGAC